MTRDPIHELAERWNAGDEEAWLWEFCVTLWERGGRVARGQFFDTWEEALQAAGLA